jgi:AcrR family transcriptional regulator
MDKKGLDKAAEVEQRIQAACLTVAGQRGYRNASVSALVTRYGGYRGQFYRYFDNFAQCYAAAYERHSTGLAERLLAAAAQEDGWRQGFRAALAELGRFACEDPNLARGLLLEVHVAGATVRDHRFEVLERLSNALDRARRESPSRHSPPPLTAAFIVGGIEAAVGSDLRAGEPHRFFDSAVEIDLLVADAFGLAPAGAAT